MNNSTKKIIKNVIELLPTEGIKEFNTLLDNAELDDSKILALFKKYNIKAEDVRSKIGGKNE